MKTAQKYMVLTYMRETGSITQQEANFAFGCTRLSGRIYDLKKIGHEIVKEWETSPNRFGVMTRYARYRLREGKA